MNDDFTDRLRVARRELFQRLTIEERLLIADHFFITAKEIIIDNAPQNLNENEMKRYVFEKMYNEPPPAELWR